MMRIPPIVSGVFLAATLLLPACSPPSPERDAATSTGPGAAKSGTGAVVSAAASSDTDAHAKPDPGALGVFKDWTVGCDNGGVCKAVALDPEIGDEPPTLMSIARAPGGDPEFIVMFTGADMPAPPIGVEIDGRRVAVSGRRVDGNVRIDGADARAIATAAANGRTLSIRGSDGPASAISLSGLSAALRYMDAEQQLAGTNAAIVARGSGTPDHAPPALPVIRAVAASGMPAPVDAAMIAKLRKTSGCAIADYMDEPPEAESFALGGGKSLLLMPCDSGAYNLLSIAYVIDGVAAPVPARFDQETGMGDDATQVQIVNADFENGVLGTFAKGRGIGDCGVFQDFVWDGTQFRLSEQREMGECRGSTDYITTWRARVAR